LTTDTQTAIDLDDVRSRINTIGEELQKLHIGDQMHDVITMGILCLLSKSHLLQLGLHGNNKSRVAADLSGRVTDLKTFVLGASKFSGKGDLVGGLDLKALDEGVYKYRTKGMFPDCDVAVIEEVCEVTDAIKKEMHSPMNERRFSNGGVWEDCPLITIFGSTNLDPDLMMETAAAYMDRWHLKIKVEYPQSREEITRIRALNRQLRRQALDGAPEFTTITKRELLAAQHEVLRIKVTREVDDTVFKIQKKLNVDAGGIVQSPRRLTFIDPIIQASAWLRGNPAVDLADLAILKYAFWHRYTDIEAVDKVMAVEAKSHISQSNELLKDIERIFGQFQKLPKGDQKRQKLKAQADEKALKLSKMRDEFELQKKNPAIIEKAYDKAQRILHSMIRQM